MRRIAIRAAICCISISGLTACTSRSRVTPEASPMPAGFDPTAVVATGSAAAQVTGAPSPTAVVQPSQQLIRRGRIGVQVQTLGDARERLERSTAAVGGQVTRATVEERERAEYLIRVPPDRLEALMDSVAALGEVEARSVGVEDVTDRVIDAQARLTSLRASRERLRQLLDRAATVQDVVTVERELARMQAEIESLEARLAALQARVAMADLSVTLRQRPVLGPLGVVAAGLGTAVRKLFIWR